MLSQYAAGRFDPAPVDRAEMIICPYHGWTYSLAGELRAAGGLPLPVAADRTRIECTWAFAPEAVARPGFDPGYAVEFWDITNRQDWAACESVQRGLASPHASPGPLSPAEDAVYSFVTAVARGYRGESVWAPARPQGQRNGGTGT